MPYNTPTERVAAAPAPALERRESPWRVLLQRTRWRDRRFFPLFDLHARLCVEAVDSLRALLADVADPQGRVRQIEAIEKRADDVVDEVHAVLRRSLMPPFPRAAIVGLIGRLDDVLDLAEDAAQAVHLYHVTAVTPAALRLADLAAEAAGLVGEAVAALAEPGRTREVLELCARIDGIEALADHVMLAAMSQLFRDEPDTRQLIKLRAVYESLEGLTDRCKDVGKELEALILGRLA